MNISKGENKAIEYTLDMTYDEFIAFYNNSLCMGLLNDESITVNGIRYKVKDGEVHVLGFDYDDRENPKIMVKVSLPHFVSCIDDIAFKDAVNLTEISGDGIITVGKDSFKGCNRLKRVNFPKLINVLHGAFCNCVSLSDIDLSNCEKIGVEAFFQCVSITEIKAPKCTKCGMSAFSYCYSLTNCEFDSVESFSNDTFIECIKLKRVFAPAITLGLPSLIDDMRTSINIFNGCINLSEVSVGNYVGSLDFFHWVFVNCNLLYYKHIEVNEKEHIYD